MTEPNSPVTHHCPQCQAEFTVPEGQTPSPCPGLYSFTNHDLKRHTPATPVPGPAPGPFAPRTIDVEELRKLAITWRWWGATQATGMEARTWVWAARELETKAGLPAPSQAVVMAPNFSPTHRCPVCGGPFWDDGEDAPLCRGRVDLDDPVHARMEHDWAITVPGADLPPWATWEFREMCHARSR